MREEEREEGSERQKARKVDRRRRVGKDVGMEGGGAAGWLGRAVYP